MEEQRENFVAVVRKREMLAATKVKMSDSEKISEQEHVRQFLHKRVRGNFWKFHFVVVQNNGNAKK